jgi:hypothetical protein
VKSSAISRSPRPKLSRQALGLRSQRRHSAGDYLNRSATGGGERIPELLVAREPVPQPAGGREQGGLGVEPLGRAPQAGDPLRVGGRLHRQFVDRLAELAFAAVHGRRG